MNELTLSEIKQIMKRSFYTAFINTHPHITYYRFFRELVIALQPSISVELGTAAGGASMYMAAGCVDCKVVTIDNTVKYPEHLEHIKTHYDNWKFLEMDTIDAVDFISAEYVGKIGLLFVDATHESVRVLEELIAYKELLADGCVVVFDDIELTKDMKRLWTYLQRISAEYDLEIGKLNDLHSEVGFGVLIYKSGSFDKLL